MALHGRHRPGASSRVRRPSWLRSLRVAPPRLIGCRAKLRTWNLVPQSCRLPSLCLAALLCVVHLAAAETPPVPAAREDGPARLAAFLTGFGSADLAPSLAERPAAIQGAGGAALGPGSIPGQGGLRQSFTPGAESPGRLPPHGWSPYRGAFGLSEAGHLLRRTVIGPRFAEIREAESTGLGATLDRLLARHDVPPPGSWTREPIPDWNRLTPAERDSVLRVYVRRQTELRLWWTVRIVESPPDLTEVMTLFWHDHFATALRDVIVPQAMYAQQELFRKHATGSFAALLLAVVRDPAMLIWLDGRSNVAGAPNENFARELFELFTMGEGAPYTQDDVREAARALTGWTTDGLDSWFVPARHDAGRKTILGQSGNFGAAEVVSLLLARPETADHLAGKLYRRFLHADPAPEDVRALGELLRASDYELAPVLRTILGSSAFHQRTLHGAVVKDGVDVYAGTLRSFEVEGCDPLTYPHQARFLLEAMTSTGQLLFDPPDVAGWPGHLHWINTQTLPSRKALLDALISGRSGPYPLSMGIKVLDVVAGFRDPGDPEAIVDDLALLHFGQAPTPLVRATMLATLLQGAEVYDWSVHAPDARVRLEDLFRFVARLPEGQLK